MTPNELPLNRDFRLTLVPSGRKRTRDLIELIVGYGAIIGVIWCPEHLQRILSPLVLLLTLGIVLARQPSRRELGLGWRGFVRSFWILPAAIALGIVSCLIAQKFGTLHSLYRGDFSHIAGYVVWTIYQQFLLQDYFMDRLLRLGLSVPTAVTIAGTLFAAAHLPSPWLTAATLVWVSFPACCSGAIAVSGCWGWLRDCSGCVLPCASRMRSIIICAWVWDICGIGRCRGCSKPFETKLVFPAQTKECGVDGLRTLFCDLRQRRPGRGSLYQYRYRLERCQACWCECRAIPEAHPPPETELTELRRRINATALGRVDVTAALTGRVPQR